MKTIKIILIALAILTTTSYAKEKINHWQIIKKYIEENTPEAGVRYKEYMGSLSVNELIIAARQCSEEVELSISPKDWDMAGMALSFFYEYYPQKTNNLKDISPLLNDLRDKKQSPFWRHSIMYLLDCSLWHNKLNSEQRLIAAKVMYEIYSDDSENILLKPKAIRKSTELLKAVYSTNLWNDPNVEQLRKSKKMSTQNLIETIRSGEIMLSPQTIKANEKVLAEIDKSIKTQIKLFSNKTINPDIQESIIVAWGRYHKSNLAPPQVSQILANAVDHYKDYDERLWQLLVKTNIEDFGNQSATSKLQEMMSEAKDKTVKEHLIYLNKKLEKEKRARSDPNNSNSAAKDANLPAK